ncbi:helix-turn-helix domain-containing protein [Lacticaseibacillus jixianensis]|uniref:Helix-turn-helix domain-containing protein n=1 Tax=Lacticaseibacillus jixianensis TaxID=2486012 RepID=A0ABW4B7B9_9LACO|nr:helix-turn-helix transcriptional regulator [Lacticaseibacillus jixianensis]
MTNNNMGRLYKQARQQRGLTLSEAGQDVGASSYSRFENGKSDINNSRLGWSQEALGLYPTDLRNADVMAPVRLGDLAYAWGNDAKKIQDNLIAIDQLAVAPDNPIWSMVKSSLTELLVLTQEPVLIHRRISRELQKRISHYLLGHLFGLNDYDFALTVMPALDPILAVRIGEHVYNNMRQNNNFRHTVYYYQTAAVVSAAVIAGVNGNLAPEQLVKIDTMLDSLEMFEYYGVLVHFDCSYARSLLEMNAQQTSSQIREDHLAIVKAAEDLVITPRFQYIVESERQSGRLPAAALPGSMK